MSTTDLWLTDARLVLPERVIDGALHFREGRIAAIRRAAPARARRLRLAGSYLAPGFIDLHVWGEPESVSSDAARGGAAAFLTTLGPEAPRTLMDHVRDRVRTRSWSGAECLGLHLEGPFVNPVRGGALPRRGMRAPTVAELQQLWRTSQGRLRLVTIAPELPGALAAVHWCRQHGVAASLGHSIAGFARTIAAADAGARAVTHVFNGMPLFHHRVPGLLDAALTDGRLTTMVIADGVHVSPHALRLLLRAKGPERIALVTDSIRRQGWDVVKRRGAFYLRRGRTLAGSDLTMVQAVRNMIMLAGASLPDAIRMATAVPARLLRLPSRGQFAVGQRADLAAFDRRFRVLLTVVGGRVAYQRKDV